MRGLVRDFIRFTHGQHRCHPGTPRPMPHGAIRPASARGSAPGWLEPAGTWGPVVHPQRPWPAV